MTTIYIGIDPGESVWHQEAGPTVFAPFSEDTPEVQDEEGVGRFGWARDPEGNRIELWEPAAEVS